MRWMTRRRRLPPARWTASVAQFPFEMGKAAVESAVKVMNGEKLPADIMVRLEMVTKETLSK